VRFERPGAVNAHTHLYSALIALWPEVPRPAVASGASPLRAILEALWWRLDRALDLDLVRASARLYAARALLAGTTTLVDHHESPCAIEGSLDVIADACEALGCRAVLAYGATERNGGRDEARRGLAENARFLRENRRPLVRGLVGVHAGFTVSDDTLREAADLARAHGVGLHLHLAEDACDVGDARARGHAGPLERLEALGALVPGSVLAHGVHLDEGAVARAERAGAWLVHNPRSNEGNGVGYARSLHAGRRVALGTDGYPPSMDDELAAAERWALSHGGTAAWVAALPRAGRELAAKVLGAAEIEADRVRGERVDGAVRIDEVIVAGRRVVEGGRLVTASLDEIVEDARGAAARLARRMEGSRT
jgi:cytosine/adenosine deaminase-related metal-dependent hydrolase